MASPISRASSGTASTNTSSTNNNSRWSRLFWLGVILSSAVLVLAGLWLSTQPAVVYDEAWCDAMLEVSHISWQESDFTAFAEHCLNPAAPIPSAPAD